MNGQRQVNLACGENHLPYALPQLAFPPQYAVNPAYGLS